MAEHRTWQRSRICNFFKNGRCNRGASCRFSHDLESTEPAQEVAPRGQGRAPPRSPLHIRLRTWKFDIPQSRELAEPLNITELQAFFSTAWDLVTSGEVDILHQTVDALASDGGLTRINEAATTIAAGHSDRQCLQYGEKILLPLVKVFAHPSLTQSFILEKPMGIIHNFLYGLGGSRAVALFSSASRFFSLFKAQPAERLSAVFAVLTCLRNIVELNSSAKVVQEIHDVVVDLADILEEDLAQSYEARRLFQRIKDRLDEGSAMPNAHARQSKPSYLSQFPALNLERDQPGQLSPQGPRHDNDHEDVSLISILPTASEVQSQRAEYLPVRDPRSLHLGGTEGLIDRQFRLLREDTIGQLRDIVRAETESLRDPSSLALVPRNAQQRRFAYKNVELEQITFSRVGGLRAELSFSQPQAVAKKSELLRREWWEHSRRLCSDALLCLIDATHNVTFFTVCGEEPSGSREKGARSKLLYQDADRASVTIQLIEPHQLDIARLVGALPDTASHAHVLCEFPGVLLPSFYPTLKALQTMSTKLDLPFTEIIAPSDTRPEATAVEPPLYARKPGFKFDLRSIVKDEHLELSLGEGFDYTALAAKSSLDEAQQSAVIDALTRKLALVQGPPGTGKSFTGVSIIKVLLDNASKARLGPIICVCYTNHALDQLLEHLIEDDVEGIIRVGSRSKSELVKRLNLRDHVQAAERTPVEKYRYGTSKSAIELEAEEMKPLLEILSWPDNPQHVKNFLRTAFPLHYQQIYGIEEDEEGYQVTRYDRREAITRWLHPRGTRHHISDIVSRPKDRSVDQLKFADVRTMTLRERQKLYDHWTETLKNNVLTQLRPAFAEIREYVQELEQCRKEDDLRVLATAKVIGVTTSGLARNLDVLRRLHSKVLVCEEAGEVLEAHLLTALLPSVEHAILIGDHQQLKPQIANYDLSSENPRGVQYSLDISLFERLLLPNVPRAPAIPYSTLRTQRRMHPSIAHLIRSTLYPGLIDHESVKAYPKVEGMRDRLFWFHHDHPENSAERQDTTSHTNEYEVEIVVALVHHLVRQSTYNSEDIAVLTPYLGQLHKIRNKLASSFEIVVGERDQVDLEKEGFKPVLDNINQALMARKTSLSRAVRLATVDNFQGEEAKVVIISLVRSNQERRCGFLRTTNRINVLLSRAKHGMYLIGDSNTYRHVTMWQKIIGILENSGALGNTLALRCPRHPSTAIEVANVDDFAVKAPEGGCDLMCDWRLTCGHKCINKCHNEVLHQEVFCREVCPRPLAGCDHACPLPCGASCQPCKVQIHNIELPCGHVEESLDCYLAQDPKLAQCCRPVEVKVPLCGHKILKQCWEPEPGPDYRCTAICGHLLSCGHDCESECYVCKPRKDGRIHRTAHGKCNKPCGRPFNTCSHGCKKKCHVGSPCGLCKAPCEVRCAHSKCAKSCSEPCAPCAEACTWACPHTGGKCSLPCAVPCNKLPCSKRCESMLDCGHRCPSVCGETCPSTDFCQICCSEELRATMVDYLVGSTYGETNLDEDPCLIPDCGHLITMSSMDGNFSLGNFYEIDNDTGEVLALKGSAPPFSVEDIKNCPVCRGPLRNINRYSRIIRRSAIDEATKKFVSWSNAEIIKHADSLHRIQQQLRESEVTTEDYQSGNSFRPSVPNPEELRDKMTLRGDRNEVIANISMVRSLQKRYDWPFLQRQRLEKFLNQVREEEQPFRRLWDLSRARQRRNPFSCSEGDLDFTPDTFQSRAFLMSLSLSIQFDITILADALTVRKKMTGLTARYDWAAVDLEVDFSEMRAECSTLANLCLVQNQPRLEIEAKLAFAHLAALERSAIVTSRQIERSNRLQQLGLDQVSEARRIHEQFPGQTTGVMTELEAVERMLNDGTFYNVVTSEEKQAVYEAMRQQFSGTGHWYTCANGHAFTVGECGMPMEETRCPQCGSPIGGRHHEPAQGVRRIDDLQAAMGNLELNDGV